MKTYVFFRGAAIVCVIAFLWCIGPAKAEKEDWKTLMQDYYGGSYYYDAGSVKHTKNNTITVWARTDTSKYLYEIDCKNKKARILQGFDSGASEWFAIAGGSDELLYEAVCP